MRDDLKTADDMAFIAQQEVSFRYMGSGFRRLGPANQTVKSLRESFGNTLRQIAEDGRRFDIDDNMVTPSNPKNVRIWDSIETASVEAAQQARFRTTTITQTTRIRRADQ